MLFRRCALARAALLLILLAGCAGTVLADTTVILVRHAEKTTAADDPDLSEAGQARAAELARTLADIEIDAIYSTDFKRTRNTAAAVAAAKEIEIQLIRRDELSTHVAELPKRILADHPDGTVLVVGHSNTVPALIESFGVPTAKLTEKEYDDLYVVTVQAGGKARLMHLHFGAVSP